MKKKPNHLGNEKKETTLQCINIAVSSAQSDSIVITRLVPSISNHLQDVLKNQKLSIVSLKSALFRNHLSISSLFGFSLVLSPCRFLLEFLQLQGLFRPDLPPLLCNLLFLSPQMAQTATQKIRRWDAEHCEKTQGTLKKDVPWIQIQIRTEGTLQYSLAF
ncbi:hypothetical protein V6Z11_D13G118100 [Gossypium hirsutum]|uniref:Uncharacterized protein n=1 Tax=Gossypium hirsutum TaxID=3635 RepID=A0A1U8KV94_GOSHI|nr:uncharacterized protein LOC107919988 [Gossypium hirsutum]XP_040964771.1 uncharacterized protein LOC107919988 [Gossypium hirsutum]XP_040964772.1 uncharacterized protein LOC107919988 [Gossypium hirsutum]